MIRVVLTGAECTGKSTLAGALAAHYGEPHTSEFVREYVDSLDHPLAQEDLESIARGQLSVEDAPLRQAGELIIHDTNILSSIIYAKHYFNTQLDWVEKAFLQRGYALYLLCSPDGIKWQADPGQRESAEVRAALSRKFEATLIDLGLPYHLLQGRREQRLREAVRIIDRLIQA
jgi:nicotinamide riboside kinase